MSTWIGKIQFGLVSLDVSLERATVDKSLKFKQFDSTHHLPIHRVSVDEFGNQVSSEQIVKGLLVDDKVVLFNEDELKELKGNLEHCIEIIDFVPYATIPIWTLGNKYYVLPRSSGKNRNKSYKLLVTAMTKSHTCAIIRFVLRTKQYTGICYLSGDRGREYLMLGIMPYADEIVDPKSLNELNKYLEEEIDISKRELDQAKTLISTMICDRFEPDRYRDEYRDRINQATERKMTAKDRKNKSNIVSITRARKKVG